MSKAVGPYGVSRVGGLVAFVTLALVWRVGIGVDLWTAVVVAAMLTTIAGVAASWGLGRCGFVRSLDALDARDLGLSYDDPQ